MSLAPYFTTSIKRSAIGKLESLHRVLTHLETEVQDVHKAEVRHCIDMLKEAFPDPADSDQNSATISGAITVDS